MSENASICGVATSADAGQSNEAIARAERSAALATLAIAHAEERSGRENDSASAVASSDSSLTSVKLRVGGVVFEVEKSTLLRFGHTFFHGLFSSGLWQPEADGAYFIDRPALGFDRILEYLSSGKLSVEGLSDLEVNCMYSSLDYLLIPYQRLWKYDTESLIEGFSSVYICELKDGRLCGANGGDIIVWNMDTIVVEMTLNGHTDYINQVIELKDGRVCSCSHDETIKLWSIDSGLCELTLTGHSDTVFCIMQLFDGRVCSGSGDETIRVWDVSTGVCVMTMNTQFFVYCFVQLSDGRICCGDSGGTIYIYSLMTGVCELSWNGHTDWISEILCIDVTRVCSGSGDSTIKVWSTATGECEISLEGHDNSVNSMVLMQDGRLCTASYDDTLKLWNLETGECEKTLVCTSTESSIEQVLQLNDGRFAVTTAMVLQELEHPQVWLWS